MDPAVRRAQDAQGRFGALREQEGLGAVRIQLFSELSMGKIEEVLKKYPMPFIQVSARTGDNISNLFPTAIEETIRVSRNATE